MEDNIVKNIVLNPEQNKKNTKKINWEREKKFRVETKTWGLNEEQLTHEKQLTIIRQIYDDIDNHGAENINQDKDDYVSKFINHVKQKLYGYRHQDIIKKKLDESKFVDFIETISLLTNSNLKCHYCACETYILYERVRELKQWSLDRINNDIGHNSGNLVIACLECNLKRRRTNKDAFMFTKNMVIIKGDK